ncbi:MAG: FIST C-terminal domain-containing protein [Bacteriovoracaceae bacterium]|nr:FIST C-terminal domain-containing protein [Bacteriovoracaceae bacterium]
MKTPKAYLSLEEFRKDPENSIKKFLGRLERGAAITYIFIGSEEFLPVLEEQLKGWEGEVCACTTGGEILTDHYFRKNIVGFSLVSDEVFCKSLYFELDVDEKGVFPGMVEGAKLVQEFRLNRLTEQPESHFFSTMVIDGMSLKEEIFVNAINRIMVGIPFIGGSAGDNFKFKHTYLYDGEKFRENIAHVIVYATILPFKIFKTQDFVTTQKRMVITESDPSRRRVTEIDGIAANIAYAQAIGVKPEDLNLDIFANYHLIVNYGGQDYIRSVMHVNSSGTLIFACAIETGVVVRLGKRVPDFAARIKALQSDVEFNIDASLLFECSLRRIDVLNANPEDRKLLLAEYKRMNAIGFHTYGEQFESVHINQTLTGIMLGHTEP